MIYKRARTSCADAVHAFVQTVFKIYYFGVLPAQFYSYVRLGRRGLERRSNGHHFLNKFYSQSLAQIDRTRARHAHIKPAFAQRAPGFLEQGKQSLLDMRAMAAVFPVYYAARVIQQH